MWISNAKYVALLRRVEALERNTDLHTALDIFTSTRSIYKGKAIDNTWSYEQNKPINELVIAILKYLKVKIQYSPEHTFLTKKENNESFS